MKIFEIMKTNGGKIYEQHTLVDIIELLTVSEDKTFPVLNGKEEVTGIITAKVLIKLFIPGYFSLLENFNFIDDFGPLEDVFSNQIKESLPCGAIIAKDIMLTRVIRIKKDTSILKASSLMLVNNIEFLPVVDENNKYLGSVKEKDLLKYLLSDLDK